MKTVAIVPAAGSGARMGADMKKQFLMLGGKPILAHTLLAIASCKQIDEIILVAPGDELGNCKSEIVEKYKIEKVVSVIEGGLTRNESVSIGFDNIPGGTDYVLVHDGARPFVTERMVDDVLALSQKYGAATVAIRVVDTLKKVKEGIIQGSMSRDDVVRIQTPQCFRRDVLQHGLETASRAGLVNTDESSIVERLGLNVHIAEGSETNIKITTYDDLKIAEALLGIHG